MDIETKRRIHETILKCGLDASVFIVGVGSGYNKKKRFVFDVSNRRDFDRAKIEYAIKYFADYQFYIVWKNLQTKKDGCSVRRSVFSVDADGVLQNFEFSPHKVVYKRADTRGGYEETVHIFSWDELVKFIESLTESDFRR